MARGPSITAEDLLASGQIPNVDPAGTSPWMRSVPSPMWPPAGVIPELNSVWLDPGMLMETGTGFGSRVPAASSRPTGGTPFPFGFAFMPPSPPGMPLGGSPSGDPPGPNWLGALADILGRGGGPGGAAPRGDFGNVWGPDALGAAVQSQYGVPDPSYSLYGPESAPVLNPGDFSLGAGNLYDLGPTTLGPVFGDESVSSAIQNFWGAPNPSYSVSGAADIPWHQGQNFSLPPAAEAGAAGASGASGGIGLGNVAGAAGAGLSIYDMTQSGVNMGNATGAMAGTLAALGFAGPAMFLAAPAIAALIYNNYFRGKKPHWSILAQKTGLPLRSIPGQPHAAVDTDTGAIVWWDPKKGYFPSPQTQSGQPASAEQLLDWRIPSPMYPETSPVTETIMEPYWTPDTGLQEFRRVQRTVPQAQLEELRRQFTPASRWRPPAPQPVEFGGGGR